MSYMSNPTRADLSNTSNEGAIRAAKHEVKDDVAALREDISSLADSVRRLASEQTSGAAAAVQEKMSDVQDAAATQLAELEVSIRKNPTQAALIAAGLGFLVGLVVLR